MLLGILGKAAAVISDIIAHPIQFLGNLVAGVMQGLKNFMSKIGTYLIKGLMDWLFGALAGAGLQLPEKFDLQGIISIVLQILGLTYANFRARAVAIVGEPVVAALEKAAEVFKVVLTEGIPGLWRFIKDQLANLKSMVLDAIFNYIKDKVIMAGITWIIGLLNPASAFFKACKAIYDIVMFFVNRGSQILALVNAVIDSMAAIAKGSIGVAATFVENALAKAIPVAIGFLASLLGLGDPSKPVRGFIEKAQAPVNKAIDWVINLAVKGTKALLVGVKGAVKSVLEWWKQRKRFKAGGKSHEMYFSGDERSAQLMMSSDPQLVQSFVNKAAGKIKGSDPNKTAKLAAIGAINAAITKIKQEMGKAIDKQDKNAIVAAFSIVGDNLPTLVELDEDDDREVCDIQVERPNFTQKVRDAIAIDADKEDRRHIVSSQDMAEHYEKSLRKNKMWEAAKLLLERGQPVQKPLSDKKIEAAAQQRHKKFFNDVHNLFPGPLEENRALGRRLDPGKPGMGKKKLREHIEYIKERWALVPAKLEITGM